MTNARLRQLVDEINERMREMDSLVPAAGPAVQSIRVKPGDDVAAAFTMLQESEAGGIILAQPGTYDVRLKGIPRPETAPLVMVTTDNGSDLPHEGEQITREHGTGLAHFTTSTPQTHTYNGAPRSGNLLFQNVGFAPSASVDYTLVELGPDNIQTPADLPFNIRLDRVLLQGMAPRGQHRGVTVHARKVRIEGCGFYDFCEKGRDSQAVCAWNGGHDVEIDNSRLEASAENILLGGGNSVSEEMQPTRWRVRRSVLRKDPAWREWPGGGSAMNVKALLELKSAIDCDFDGLLLENAWPDDWGAGVAFTYKCSNASRSPWAVTKNIRTRNCIVRNADTLITLVGWGDGYTATNQRVTQRMADVRFENIVATGLTSHGIRCANPPDGLTIDHITMLGNTGVFFDFWFHATQPRGTFLSFTNSVFHEAKYGIKWQSGEGTAGLPALLKAFERVDFRGNVIAGNSTRQYGADNLKVTVEQLAAALDANARMTAGGFDVPTTDGKPAGHDLAQLEAAMEGGTWEGF